MTDPAELTHLQNRLLLALKRVSKTEHSFNEYLASINEAKHFNKLDEAHLLHHLPNFILAARKLDGSDCDPSSLKTGIFNLVRAFGRRVVKVYDIRKDESSAGFAPFWTTGSNNCSKLTTMKTTVQYLSVVKIFAHC